MPIQRVIFSGVFVFAACARAGVVTFDPAVVVIDPAVSTTAQVQVSVGEATTEDGDFDSVDLIIGADVQRLISDFSYNLGFCEANPHCGVGQPSRGLGAPFYGPLGSTYVGGFINEPVSSILVGTLQLDAAGIAPGEYILQVDSEYDGLSGMGLFGTNDLGTFGSARVIVVPEPGMLAMVALGAWFLGRHWPASRQWHLRGHRKPVETGFEVRGAFR